MAGKAANIRGCSQLQLLCNFTGNRPQSATFHNATFSNKGRTTRLRDIKAESSIKK